MASPSGADFAALARSSPWRWRTLRFTARWPGDPWRPQELRAWLRRPDRLRVETIDGALVQVVREPRDEVGPEAVQPALRADGLVAARPDRFASSVSFDAPMYRDYFWVAMLDPVELADGRDPGMGTTPAGTVIDGVLEVEHGGRAAWEAILRTTPAYEPRCTCCALLRSREIDLAEMRSGAGPGVVLDDYPDAYRVRLDVETGVCVLTVPIGGHTPGSGHELRIEAVDEAMPDDLFEAARKRRPSWFPRG